MSCWIVSPVHIDVLVSALVHKGIIRKIEIGRVRNGFVCENVESYTYRYAHIPEAMAEASAFDREESEKSWTEYEAEDRTLSGALDCYMYQACEHPEWEKSETRGLCLKLLDVVGKQQTTVWGIDEHHIGTLVRRPVVLRATWVRPLTRAQRVALKAVYDRAPLKPVMVRSRQTGHIVQTTRRCEGAERPMSYRAFRAMCKWPSYDAVMVPWLDMWLGIEPDGYTHS